MLIPIRCFTCGSLIADKYDEYKKKVLLGEDPKNILDSLNIKRYCCRRMFVSNVDIVDYIIPYYESLQKRQKEFVTD
jgi:DNA-directed RNA polymerase subunit N